MMDMGCTAQVFSARRLVEFDVPSHQYDLQNKNQHYYLQYEVELTITLICTVLYINEMIDNIFVIFCICSIDNHCYLQFGIFLALTLRFFPSQPK